MWQSLLQSGAVVSNGTDTPVEDVDPIACFYSSVTRKIGKAELEIGVHNLLDRDYPELVAGGLVAPGQPIAVFGTVRYDF